MGQDSGAWVQILDLPLPSDVPMGRLPSRPVPQFPQVKSGERGLVSASYGWLCEE